MRLPVLLFLVILSIQSLAQKVTSDQDDSVDFTEYSTYKFLGWQEDSDQLVNELDQRRMRDAFVTELKARGLTRDDNSPDLSISLFLVLENKSSTTGYTDYYRGGYGMYRRGGWGWGVGYAQTTYTEQDYVKGTMVMDVYDEATKSLVWQGVMSGVVNENPKKREKNIPKAIKKLMKKYPVAPKK